MKETAGQLQTYDVIASSTQTRPRGIALSSIVNFANTQRQFAQLQPLPPQTRSSIDEENEAKAYDEPPAEETHDTDGPELPPELQLVLEEDGLPGPPEDLSDIIYDDDDDSDLDFDASDLKNLPDFDPDQDWEA